MNLAAMALTSSFPAGPRIMYAMKKIDQSIVFKNKIDDLLDGGIVFNGAKREADCEPPAETSGRPADRPELTKGNATMAEATLGEIIDRHQAYVIQMLETANRTNDPFWAKKLRRMADLLMDGIGEYQKRLPA